MPMPHALQLLTVVLISTLAGVMNAIAGGGTLLTFPALVGLGISPIVANGTSTVALWPGALSSIWGYRGELAGARQWAIGFAAPSLVGGGIGAWLLLRTPPARFAALVPWLVLAATALFMTQPLVMRAIRRRSAEDAEARPAPAPAESSSFHPLPSTLHPHTNSGPFYPPPSTLDPRHGPLSDRTTTGELPSVSLMFWQLLVGIYGGYFGAGVGILMLAVLGFMGLTNIHRMNGLKNWGGLCMNAVAAVTFAFSSLVNWPIALAMAVGSISGGYLGSRGAQRTPQKFVRRAVVLIGLGGGLWLMMKTR